MHVNDKVSSFFVFVLYFVWSTVKVSYLSRVKAGFSFCSIAFDFN